MCTGISRLLKAVALGLTVAFAAQSYAATYTGNILWLELWPNGNVAFTVSGATVPCTLQQFVLNSSTVGTKNMYAVLVALKAQDKPVRVVSSACGPAEGSPSSNYALVDYMYYD